MSIRTILQYPDPRLREPTKPIVDIDDDIRALIDDMAETMYAAPGVGLAAPQIGESKRLFIVDVADEDEPSDLHVFINPTITRQDGKKDFREGCLSFPNVYEDIERPASVTVEAMNAEGKPFALEADGLLAVAIQHEFDHLEGVLMIDHLSPLKKRIVHRNMLKQAQKRA